MSRREAIAWVLMVGLPVGLAVGWVVVYLLSPSVDIGD
jgi:hypothetical protein